MRCGIHSIDGCMKEERSNAKESLHALDVTKAEPLDGNLSHPLPLLSTFLLLTFLAPSVLRRGTIDLIRNG
jgi:hypothetical protein